jgi:choline dehydrogenase-like flavoprotein
MSEHFDFVIVGGGSAGAVIASRLSEDPSCRVALIEAGDRPPAVSAMPIACAAMQRDPATDWMYTADPGNAGLGLNGRRVPVPRGKMLGGSSSLNYMLYVRGHPGDFDAWAEGGATGWSYGEVLPYFRKSEGLAASDDVVIDAQAHNGDGPLGVAVRAPVLPAARGFVEAAVAAGLPHGDYNGRDRGGAAGVVSLGHSTTRRGKRSSTYQAFLEGEPERRPNLTIITGAQATRVIVDGEAGHVTASGVEYRTASGERRTASADKEVILSAGAIGSPHVLLVSGIGPRHELEAVGVPCVVDAPHVGKHLKDHLMVPLFFPAPGVGVTMQEIALAMGPAALRGPGGPLPADPGEDVHLSADLHALKQEAERQFTAWETTGHGLLASSLADAVAFWSTGLGDTHSHDAQIILMATAGNDDLVRGCLNIDTARYFDDAAARLAPEAAGLYLLPNLALPHSEGEIVLHSSDPSVHPSIRMHYYDDPHDMQVMVAVVRRTLEIAAHWPGNTLGPVLIPPFLAAKHGYVAGGELSDALLEDFALHFSLTVYHHTCTCRIGDVVDPRLRVLGVDKLRVADASVMPNITSGNTNAPTIMIGEKAAEMIAADHGVHLRAFVGARP